MAQQCIDTLLFGQVCDNCDGGAIFKVVSEVLKFFTGGVVALAVICVIVCGVMIITARDDANQLAKGKRRLLDIIIGLVVYAFMFTIANFLIPGGIVTSTIGSETSSCPDKPTTPGSSDPGTGDDPPAEAGKYPMAHKVGEPVPGYIDCPRNKDYKYITNPTGKTDLVDKYFQSVAVSCPFTAVSYTQTAQDLACSADGTMHYDANRQWCLINSKIDVWEYQAYLKNNKIGQDGKMCTTTGECNGSSTCPGASHVGTSDWGMCNYFSYTFASNLNNGQVVSNDAYARGGGYATHYAYWGCASQGTWDTTWGKRKVAMYNDNLADISLNPNVSQPLPHAYYDNGNLSNILKRTRQGIATPIGVTRKQRGEGNNGHYMTAIGFKYSCANGAQCPSENLVVLNTEGTISTLGASKYKLGYAR